MVSVDPLIVGSVSNGSSGSSQTLTPTTLNSPCPVLTSTNAGDQPAVDGLSQLAKRKWSLDFSTRPALTAPGIRPTRIAAVAMAA